MRHHVPVEHPDFGRMYRCPHNTITLDNERHERLRRLSNLGAYADKRFENFVLPRQGLTSNENASLRLALNTAQTFAGQPQGWLILTGPWGCGKTHLAAAVGNQCLAAGEAVLFVNAPDLLDHLRSTYGPVSEIGYDELFERVRNVSLLILDDLGAENPSAWASEKFFQLFNHRYSRRLPTVITTNVSLGRIDGRIRSRMLDEDLIRRASITAPDYRSATGLQEKQIFTTRRHYQDMRLDNFDIRRGANPKERRALLTALKGAQGYAERPSDWLFFVGEYGSGKTHLAAAISNHLNERGMSTIFATVPDLMDWLRASFETGAALSFQQRFQQVRDVPLLVLDDLGSGQSSSWVREKLFQIIEHRYTGGLLTIFTAYQIEEIDRRIRSRILDKRRTHILEINVRAWAERLQASR